MEVSVIIPTYNRKKLVQEAIDSVLLQSYADYEIIVVDDGSSDGTDVHLLGRYGSRIQYVWQQNQGESLARNRGIDLAHGKYIAFLDSDDLWLPDKTAKQVSFLDANPHIGLLTCQIWYIDGHGKRLSETPALTDLHNDDLIFEKLVMANTIPSPSSVMVRAGLLEKCGGFDPTIRFGEDWDLWLKLLDHTEFALFAEPLAYLRRHLETQSYYASAAGNQQKLSEHLKLLKHAFAQRKGQVHEGLREKAFAVQYRNAFLNELAVGNRAAAVNYIERALALDTEIAGTPDFREQVVLSALRYAEIEGNDLADSGRYVQKVILALREVCPSNASFERRLMIDINLACVYTSYQQGNQRSCRHYCIKSMQLDFQLIRNRGFVSIFIQSIIGAKMKNRLLGTYKGTARGSHG